MKQVNIFTDGSCLGNPGPGGWSAIIKYGVHVKEIMGGGGHTTNNRMELTAAIQGLLALKEPCKVTVYSDSTYVVKGMSEWMKGWIKNGRLKLGSDLANVDLWIQLVEAAKPHDITWTWVKAHNGHPENERCDQLARFEASKCAQ